MKFGATASKEKGGNIIVSNLKKGYSGKIYPVNPGYKEIEGLPCYPSVADVPDPVDLAIVFVAAHMVPKMIEDCAKRNIPGVMIQSAGFSETGTKGEALQQKAKQIADKTGIRLWGPNCMGLVDARRRFIFSTVTPAIWDTGLASGNVSLIAQSGMLAGAFLIDLMSHGTMGISKVCSIGNKMDVDENDLLAYLIDDPDTAAIGLYLESFTDCRRFMALSRGTTKPVVILNGGKTARGAAAALSHTASLSASGVIVSGAMAQAGWACIPTYRLKAGTVWRFSPTPVPQALFQPISWIHTAWYCLNSVMLPWVNCKPFFRNGCRRQIPWICGRGSF